MTCTHFAEGQVLFREGDPPDCVFRVLSGAVDVLREIDGEPNDGFPIARDVARICSTAQPLSGWSSVRTKRVKLLV